MKYIYFTFSRLLVGIALAGLVSLLADFNANGAQTAAGAQSEWEKALKAAEEEGEVMVYVGGSEYRESIQEFQKSYPKIKLSTFAAARGPELLQRLMAERRAGKHVADVYMTGTGTHLALYSAKAVASVRAALMLPDVKDESKWFEGKHWYLYGGDGIAFMFEGGVFRTISHNLKEASAGELMSWWDLIKPKWKDKIVVSDPTIPSPGQQSLEFFYVNPSLGPKYIEELFGKMGVTFSRDYRQLTDWLATGKAAICIACWEEVRLAKVQGLPIDNVYHNMKEGHDISNGQGIVSLIQPAPHPNAAKVFVNWLLSRQGQMAFQEITYSRLGYSRNSLRVDLPKEKVPREYLPQSGERYYYSGADSAQKRKESLEALKQALKK